MMFGCWAAELIQLLDREAVADDLLVGDDIRRALAAVEQRHLAEGQAGSDRGDPLLALAAMRPDLHADGAARQHEEQFRLVAFADDDLALVEDKRAGRSVSISRYSSGFSPLNTSSSASANFGPERIWSMRASNWSSHHSSAASTSRNTRTSRSASLLDRARASGAERPVIGDRRRREARSRHRAMAWARAQDQLAGGAIGEVHALEVDDE